MKHEHCTVEINWLIEDMITLSQLMFRDIQTRVVGRLMLIFPISFDHGTWIKIANILV